MSDHDINKGDIVYLRISPASDNDPRYIGIVISDKSFGVKVVWYDRSYNHWVRGAMSHEPRLIRVIGPLPEWAEWDFEYE
jgi:hypothetical protein